MKGSLPPPKKKTSMEHFAILFRGEGVIMDEKGIFIQIQNTIAFNEKTLHSMSGGIAQYCSHMHIHLSAH